MAQSDVTVLSGIVVLACAVTVAVVVNGSGGVVGASGHESAFSSVHIKISHNFIIELICLWHNSL